MDKFIMGKYKLQMHTCEDPNSNSDINVINHLKQIFPDNEFKLMKSHSYFVEELPEGAVSLGKSDYSENEVFVMGNRILSTQNHPDFTSKFSLIHDLQTEGVDDFKDTPEYAKEVYENLSDLSIPNDTVSFHKVIKEFLKN